MIVKLPSGEKVEVNEADLPAFERMLKQKYAKPAEKPLEQVMKEANGHLIASIEKSHHEMVKSIATSITQGVKSIKIPEYPEPPEQEPPIVAVSVEEGSITHDRKTGRISGFRLVVER